MSLVICSNQDSDGAAQGNTQSVNDAFAFRNELSSTMTIPANSQVALQSVKVNVDGRLTLGKDNSRFYTYFGDIDQPENEDVTSAPVRVDMIEDGDTEVKELTKSDFSSLVQERVRVNTFHPNQKGQFKCDTFLDGDKKFKGFKLTFDQDNVSTGVQLTGGQQFTNVDYTNASQFTFNSSTMTRVAGAQEPTAVIFKDKPISLAHHSKLRVNISGTGNANASGVPWSVGLSRFSNGESEMTGGGIIGPNYWDWGQDDGTPCYTEQTLGFCDFAVSRNSQNELVVTNQRWSTTHNCLVEVEVEYYDSDNSDFTGDGRFNLANGSDFDQYTKVEFICSGENIGAFMYHNGSSELRKICDYDAADLALEYFKPINQACWCLHPVLGVGKSGNSSTSTLHVEHFSGLEITGYDPTKKFKGGWFETMELIGGSALQQCMELEQRPWNLNLGDDDYVIRTTNGSGGVDYSNVLILQEDVTGSYAPTRGANALRSLGFEKGIIDTPVTENESEQIFQSTVIPDLSTTQAMFVKLNNFGSKVMNAHKGNRSNIICHLPRFDNALSTGRLHFEPNNLIYIDLDNAGPLQVNEYDISFNYVNEQYAKILTGQSIVVLYFRKKPRELM